jgi:hypothetical protein
MYKAFKRWCEICPSGMLHGTFQYQRQSMTRHDGFSMPGHSSAEEHGEVTAIIAKAAFIQAMLHQKQNT